MDDNLQKLLNKHFDAIENSVGNKDPDQIAEFMDAIQEKKSKPQVLPARCEWPVWYILFATAATILFVLWGIFQPGKTDYKSKEGSKHVAARQEPKNKSLPPMTVEEKNRINAYFSDYKTFAEEWFEVQSTWLEKPAKDGKSWEERQMTSFQKRDKLSGEENFLLTLNKEDAKTHAVNGFKTLYPDLIKWIKEYEGKRLLNSPNALIDEILPVFIALDYDAVKQHVKERYDALAKSWTNQSHYLNYCFCMALDGDAGAKKVLVDALKGWEEQARYISYDIKVDLLYTLAVLKDADAISHVEKTYKEAPGEIRTCSLSTQVKMAKVLADCGNSVGIKLFFGIVDEKYTAYQYVEDVQSGKVHMIDNFGGPMDCEAEKRRILGEIEVTHQWMEMLKEKNWEKNPMILNALLKRGFVSKEMEKRKLAEKKSDQAEDIGREVKILEFDILKKKSRELQDWASSLK